MIDSYANSSTKKLFENGEHKKLPQELIKRTLFLLDIMDNVETLEDLKCKGFPPDLRLHKLKGEYRDRYAIDINKVKRWRITFRYENSVFKLVKVENYHKG